jgi:hypothetical protein
MKTFKKFFIVAFVALLLLLEANVLVAQEPYSILTGTVVGIRKRLWLDVENEKDKTIVNFRIGRNTRYTPHRYPNPGEKVKVEYLTQKGTPVAYSVTLLEGSKEAPKEGTKESPK